MKKLDQRAETVESAIDLLINLFPEEISFNLKSAIEESMVHVFNRGYNCCSHIVKHAVNEVVDNF